MGKGIDSTRSLETKGLNHMDAKGHSLNLEKPHINSNWSEERVEFLISHFIKTLKAFVVAITLILPNEIGLIWIVHLKFLDSPD